MCVIGCMVSESKQDLFRSLVTGNDVVGEVVGTLSRAIDVMEHCWKERQTGKGIVEWFSAMRSVGQHILLL